MLERKSMNVKLREYGSFILRDTPAYYSKQNRTLRKRLQESLTVGSIPNLKNAIVAVTMVKNESDIIEHTINHLLNQGVDHIIVADNLSTDFTVEILRNLEKSKQVTVAFDNEPAYYQAEKMGNLTQLATHNGANWIVPFDADEYWFAENQNLRQFFKTSKGKVFHARVHNAFPDDSLDEGHYWVSSSSEFLPKTAFRSFPLAGPTMGNHYARRPGNNETGLHIVHVPWRSISQLKAKSQHGSLALKLAGASENHGTQWKGLQDANEGRIHDIWDSILRHEPDPILGLEATGPYWMMSPLKTSTWQESRTEA